jgi:hypothetical protein
MNECQRIFALTTPASLETGFVEEARPQLEQLVFVPLYRRCERIRDLRSAKRFPRLQSTAISCDQAWPTRPAYGQA